MIFVRKSYNKFINIHDVKTPITRSKNQSKYFVKICGSIGKPQLGEIAFL